MDDGATSGADVIGPVQALVIGIDRPGSDRMISAELQDLGNQTAVRVVDMLRVRRGADGKLRRLDPVDPAGLPGTMVEALLLDDPERPPDPLISGRGGRAAVPGTWTLADRVPSGTPAAILLVEHRWAIPLREAAAALEAEIFGDAWVHPRDLRVARNTMRP
ncbi:MAG: hypothetical protein JST59_11150 [Actinobacteria bacterium]|nr:hypothetical protein [Actinomycetota bacterium]